MWTFQFYEYGIPEGHTWATADPEACGRLNSIILSWHLPNYRPRAIPPFLARIQMLCFFVLQCVQRRNYLETHHRSQQSRDVPLRSRRLTFGCPADDEGEYKHRESPAACEETERGHEHVDSCLGWGTGFTCDVSTRPDSGRTRGLTPANRVPKTTLILAVYVGRVTQKEVTHVIVIEIGFGPEVMKLIVPISVDKLLQPPGEGVLKRLIHDGHIQEWVVRQDVPKIQANSGHENLKGIRNGRVVYARNIGAVVLRIVRCCEVGPGGARRLIVLKVTRKLGSVCKSEVDWVILIYNGTLSVIRGR